MHPRIWEVEKVPPLTVHCRRADVPKWKHACCCIGYRHALRGNGMYRRKAGSEPRERQLKTPCLCSCKMQQLRYVYLQSVDKTVNHQCLMQCNNSQCRHTLNGKGMSKPGSLGRVKEQAMPRNLLAQVRPSKPLRMHARHTLGLQANSMTRSNACVLCGMTTSLLKKKEHLAQ